jgi:hypothetical protein
MFIALKYENGVLESRTEFHAGFVPDLNAKVAAVAGGVGK